MGVPDHRLAGHFRVLSQELQRILRCRWVVFLVGEFS
jgi:hypothetical protein